MKNPELLFNKKVNDFLKSEPSYQKLPFRELTILVNKELGTRFSMEAIRSRCRRLGWKPRPQAFFDTPDNLIAQDREKKDYKEYKQNIQRKYETLIERNNTLEKELEAFKTIKDTPFEIHEIKPNYDKSTGEATAVVLASDWHIEERVSSESVNGKNFHNLHIAEKRAKEFFEKVIKLVKKEQQTIEIKHLVLALLGDFISGNIHDELLENTDLTPIKATLYAKNLLASGIESILKNTKLKLTIVCHCGNHARITKKIHTSNEQGNSLEFFMYHTLADHFKNEERITWIIPEGYHSYVRIYDTIIRFHHGHAIKFGGGIGGLNIPAQKAIGQWNKIQWADYDCFGHLHTQMDGKNFLSNGCNIGYNAFAVSIKADFDTPRQTFFLVDKKRKKTIVAPILYSV